MKTAAIYARFSSDMQREESIDAQIRACKYFAQKSEYDIIKIYSDKAQSGKYTNNREQFNVMLDDARSGLFDTILVHKLNRFSRSGKDTLNLMDDLQDIGVEVVSVTERLDNTAEGRLMLYVIAGMNEFYSANLATEVLKGLKENAYSCRHTGGTPPLGYDVKDGRLVINEREAEAVKIIFRLYLEGKGYTAIIAALNKGGYLTKRGQPFGKNSLYEILKNEKYTGCYIYNRTCSATRNGKRNRHKYKSDDEIIKIENAIPVIVEKELFEMVQDKLKANQHKAARNKAKVDYLLSGKLFCGNCGGAMTGETRRYRGRTYGYYVCNHSKLKRGCTKKNIRQEKIEEAVIANLQSTIFSEEAINNISQWIWDGMQAEEKGESLYDKCLSELKELDRKISNTMTLLIDCPDISELKDKLAQLSDEKKDLKIQLAKFKMAETVQGKSLEEIKADLTLKTRLENYPREEIKRVLDIYVHKIFVYDYDDGNPEHKHSVRMVITPTQKARNAVAKFLDSIGVDCSAPIKSKNKLSYLSNDILFLDFFVE